MHALQHSHLCPPVLLAPIHVTNVGCFDRRRLHQPSAQRGRCCCCARALRILCSRVLPPPRRPWLSPRTPWSVVVCARARECACVCVCVCVCVCQCRLHPPPFVPPPAVHRMSGGLCLRTRPFTSGSATPSTTMNSGACNHHPHVCVRVRACARVRVCACVCSSRLHPLYVEPHACFLNSLSPFLSLLPPQSSF